MDLRLLGTVELWHDGRPVPVSAPMQRAVLAALALRAGGVVSVDTLIEQLWGARPPRTASVTVRNYVQRLRRLLPEPVLRTQAPGYRLAVRAEAIDVHRFEQLVQTGGHLVADDPAAAVVQLRRALRLWRGPPMCDIGDVPLREAEDARLSDRYATATEDLARALLALEDHAEAGAVLSRLVAAHPLREQAYALLMVALYRSSRQAEALSAYRTIRGRLAREVGVDPGPELQRLQRKILTGDPGLATMTAASPDLDPRRGRRTSPRPAQLPAAVPTFTGRAAHLRLLDRVAAGELGSATIVAITGMAGVGKTALAVHWAHRARGQFPDGTLFADLRGFDPAAAPLAPNEVLDGFLRVLGVPPESIPSSLEERSALFRTQLDRLRMLVVLDNAATSEQVRWLLPASGGCLVVITSRSNLSGLATRHGAERVPVDVLPPEDALALLRLVLGPERVAAESNEAAELTRLCGGLPLALRLAAERASNHPHLTLADLRRQLNDEYERLDLLAADDDATTAVRAAFSWSYRALPPPAARLFRLLGLHPGPEMCRSVIDALGCVSVSQSRRLLDTLTGLHLVQEVATDRYRLHDLLRVYAVERVYADEPVSDRDEASQRMLDFYLHTADAVDRALMPGRRHIPLPPLRAGNRPLTFRSADSALAWCETERANLTATIVHAARTGHSEVAWMLPIALWSYFAVRKRWTDWIETHRLALAASRHSHDQYGEAFILTSIAHAYRDLRQFDAAYEHFRTAIELAQRTGDRWIEAAALNLLGITHRDLRAFPDALEHCHRSLEIFDRLGDRWGRAWALYTLAETYTDLRSYNAAIDHGRQALHLFTGIDDPWGQGWSLSILAQTFRSLRQFDQATAYCQRALSAARGIGNRHGEALTLYALGKIQCDTGQVGAAQRSWHQALEILEEHDAPQATQVRARLATLTARSRTSETS
jgi:DNA-binding SARP family transcriptional activator/tetratricopeptide (TPR) repeat protein